MCFALNAFSPRNPSLQKKITGRARPRIFCHTATGLKSRIGNATAAKHTVHGVCAPEEEATGRNRFRTAWRHALMLQHVK